jgi:hypothetical protein
MTPKFGLLGGQQIDLLVSALVSTKKPINNNFLNHAVRHSM